jgi:hypothetical protein
MIHAQRQTPTDIGISAAEFAQQSLCDRLQSGEPVAVLTTWMPTSEAHCSAN